MCEHIGSKEVRIRKSRSCFGCEGWMKVGTLMKAMTTRGDGRIYTLYLCARCQEAETKMGWRDYPYHQGDLRELWGTDDPAAAPAPAESCER